MPDTMPTSREPSQPRAKGHAMNPFMRFILTYSPFILLVAAAAIGFLHVTYYW
jgi:hypothetical protein